MCVETEHPIITRKIDGWPVHVERIHDERDGHIDVGTTMPQRYEIDQPPILIANGFGSGIQMMGRLARCLAERHGRVVWTYDDHRRPDARQDPLPYRADTIRSVIDHFDGMNDNQLPARPSVVGWSTGGYAALKMARQMNDTGEADRLGSVLTIGSAGFIGPDSAPHLLWRASQEVLRAVPQPYVRRHLGQLALRMGLNYIGRDVPLALRELRDLSRADACDDVAALSSSGLGVGVMAFSDDRIFPLRRIERVVEDARLDKVFSVLKGSHVELAWSESLADQVHAAVEKLETNTLQFDQAQQPA